MTAANHVVTGFVIGAAIQQPVLAMPLALLSHIVLDVLPHYGLKDHTSRKFLYALVIDMGIAASLLLYLFIWQPAGWPLMFICGVLAASPDLLWLPYWLWEMQGKPRPLGKVAHWLAKIQWGEHEWALTIELGWFLAAVTLFVQLTAHA